MSGTSDPLDTVRAHPLVGLALGAAAAAATALLAVVANLERLASHAAPAGLLGYVRLVAPFPAAAFALCFVGGAALPLLRTRRTSYVFGFLVFAAFAGAPMLLYGESWAALLFAALAGVVFAVPVGLSARVWVRYVVRTLGG